MRKRSFRSRSKLQLHREWLAFLDAEHLGAVVGAGTLENSSQGIVSCTRCAVAGSENV